MFIYVSVYKHTIPDPNEILVEFTATALTLYVVR
jgi:hypothetical protein